MEGGVCLEKLKSMMGLIARLSSIRPWGAIAFPGRARGDRVDNGTSVRGRGPNLPLILTLDPTPFRAHQRRTVECIVLPENFSKRLCRSVQFLRIELDSFLPNHQCDRGDLACQCQSSHLGTHAVVVQPLPY